MNLVWLALFGALGALCRVGLSAGVRRLWPASFPAGTLIVNVLGCLLIGVAAASLETRLRSQPGLRLAMTAGFLGAFTTFSAFGLESFELWRHGSGLRAIAYIGLSIGLGLLAVVLGYRFGARAL